jgi:hypothetical protein
MVRALTRRTVIAAAGGETRFVKAPHCFLIRRLKRKVHVRGGLHLFTERIDPQLIAREMTLIVAAQRNVQRPEHRAIKRPRRFQVARAKMDMID